MVLNSGHELVKDKDIILHLSIHWIGFIPRLLKPCSLINLESFISNFQVRYSSCIMLLNRFDLSPAHPKFDNQITLLL
jgi:hypothetical protein